MFRRLFSINNVREGVPLNPKVVKRKYPILSEDKWKKDVLIAWVDQAIFNFILLATAKAARSGENYLWKMGDRNNCAVDIFGDESGRGCSIFLGKLPFNIGFVIGLHLPQNSDTMCAWLVINNLVMLFAYQNQVWIFVSVFFLQREITPWALATFSDNMGNISNY